MWLNHTQVEFFCAEDGLHCGVDCTPLIIKALCGKRVVSGELTAKFELGIISDFRGQAGKPCALFGDMISPMAQVKVDDMAQVQVDDIEHGGKHYRLIMEQVNLAHPEGVSGAVFLIGPKPAPKLFEYLSLPNEGTQEVWNQLTAFVNSQS